MPPNLVLSIIDAAADSSPPIKAIAAFPFAVVGFLWLSSHHSGYPTSSKYFSWSRQKDQRMLTLLELHRHKAAVNAIAWAPHLHAGIYLGRISGEANDEEWKRSDTDYTTACEIEQVQCSPLQPHCIAIAFSNKLQIPQGITVHWISSLSDTRLHIIVLDVEELTVISHYSQHIVEYLNESMEGFRMFAMNRSRPNQHMFLIILKLWHGVEWKWCRPDI